MRVVSGVSTQVLLIERGTGKVTIGSDLSVGGTRINAANLPTSSAGLSAGDLWVDTGAGNVLKRA